jgi:hypothetical protein
VPRLQGPRDFPHSQSRGDGFRDPPEQRGAATMSAVVIIARHLALREIKQRRQKQGLREPLPFAVLNRMANEWVEQHPPELLAKAAERAEELFG